MIQHKNFIHGPHSGNRAKRERILNINRRSAVPSFYRLTSGHQLEGRHLKRLIRTTNDDELSIDTQTTKNCTHCFVAWNGSKDYLGTSHLSKFFDGVRPLAINIMNSAKLFHHLLLVLSPPRGSVCETDRYYYKVYLLQFSLPT